MKKHLIFLAAILFAGAALAPCGRAGNSFPVLKPAGQRPAKNPDKALITVNVQYNWGSNEGYQLLLDADADTYGRVFSADESYWNESGGLEPSVYEEFEYKLPANADGDLDAGNWLLPWTTASIEIEPGTYDFVIPCMMPLYYCVAFIYGEGRGNDYVFEAGEEYFFDIVPMGDGDGCVIRKKPSYDLSVEAILAPVNGTALTSEEEVSVKIANLGTKAADAFSLALTVDNVLIATEKVSEPLQKDSVLRYTFAAKADLSEKGRHTVAVEAILSGDTALSNNTLEKEVYHSEAVLPPFFCNFNTEEAMSDWLSINVDGDDAYWKLNDGFNVEEDEEGASASISYNNDLPLDDYLLTLRPVTFPEGKAHVAFYYRSSAEQEWVENLALLYGTTSEPELMRVIWQDTNFCNGTSGSSAGFEFKVVEFDIEEAGDYYFAFHAFSKPGQMGIRVDNVLIGEGSYTGVPDLRIERLMLPVSACGLGDRERIGAVVANTGTLAIADFSLACKVNGREYVSQKFSEPIPSEDTLSVWFDTMFDFSGTGNYEIVVEGKVESAMGNGEQNVDNNSRSGRVVHFEPLARLETDFTDSSQRADWTCEEGGWIYDEDYYLAMNAAGAWPLISRCVELTQGKDYRFRMDYMAGGYDMTIAVVDDFDVRYGISGTPVEQWTTFLSYRYHTTNEEMARIDTVFEAPSSAGYSFAIVPLTQHGTIYVRAAEISEKLDYDLRLEAFGGFAVKQPAEHLAGGQTAWFQLENRGKEPVDKARLSIRRADGGTLLGADSVYVGEPGRVSMAPVGFSIGEVAGGEVGLLARAVIAGHEDEAYMADNEAVATIEVTDSVMAYDQVDAGMYGDFSYQINTGGYPAGMVFRLPVTDTLTGISVGWASSLYDQDAGLYIWKWNEETASLGSLVYQAVVRKGTQAGQAEYGIPALLLEKGSYMIAVQVSGYSLVTDMQAVDALYAIAEGQAVLQRGGVGYAAIRALFGHGGNPVLKDVSVESFLAPSNGGLFSSNEPVRLKVVNSGPSTENVPVYLLVDKQAQSKTVEVAGYSSVEVEFTADLSRNEAVYQLVAFTSLEGDENPANDTCRMEVRTFLPEDPYRMTFEYCSDFSVSGFNPAWTTLDADGQPSGGWSGTSFPHEGEPFGFMAFNPGLTTPSLLETAGELITPHGGERFGLSIYNSTGEPNNDWLISPKLLLPATGAYAEFYVKSYMAQPELEKYNVLVSETGTDPDDFVVIGGLREAPETAWERVEVDLSDYAGKEVHVAFQCVSDNLFAFMIDDIFISKPAGNQTGIGLAEDVELYPNPATEAFSIRTLSAQIEQVSIYDLQGRALYVSEPGLARRDFRYNVSGFAPGMYLVAVKTGNGSAVLRLVVR